MGFLIDTCIWIDVERGIISPADVGHFTKEEPVFICSINSSTTILGVTINGILKNLAALIALPSSVANSDLSNFIANSKASSSPL